MTRNIFLPFTENSISSKGDHFEWRTGLLNAILKVGNPKTIPVQFGFISIKGFWGKFFKCDFFFIKICLIYIFDIDQLEKKLQRKQSGVKHHKPLQRNLEDMLNYSSICNCSWNLNLFWLAIIHWESIREISNFSNSSHLELRTRLSHTIFERDQGPSQQGMV